MHATHITQQHNDHSAGYENGVMEIEFNNGKRFQYAGVPQDVYDRLMRHSSPGSYFTRISKANTPRQAVCRRRS
jgi:hypothetical protein